MQRRALNQLGARPHRPRWRRLRWTLTLSFTLVTVTAVTVLFVAYGAFVVQRESGPDAFALRLRYLPVFVAALAERLEPHLGDPAQLARLLKDTYDEQLGISGHCSRRAKSSRSSKSVTGSPSTCTTASNSRPSPPRCR